MRGESLTWRWCDWAFPLPRICVRLCLRAFACVNVIFPLLSLLHFSSHSCLPFHFHMHKANRQTISWGGRGGIGKVGAWGRGLLAEWVNANTGPIQFCPPFRWWLSWQRVRFLSVVRRTRRIRGSGRWNCGILTANNSLLSDTCEMLCSAGSGGTSQGGRFQVFWHIQGANDGKLESQAEVVRICAQRIYPRNIANYTDR